MIGDSGRAETAAGTSWGVRVSKVTRRSGDEAVPRTSPGSRSWCLGVPSRGSIVDPRRQIVPKGSSRRERGASRPCNGPSERGICRDELSSPE